MSMDTAPGATDFNFGRVIRRTFEIIGKEIGPLLAATAVLAGLPAALLTALQPNPALDREGSWLLWGAALIAMLIGAYLLQAAVIHMAMARLNGRATALGEVLRKSVGDVVPLILLSLLVSVALVVGFALLIVPGVILSLLWSVAAPVLVVERKGVMASLQRSRDLTRGHRWAILGLFVLVILAAFVVTLVVGGALGASLLMSGGQGSLVVEVMVQVLVTMAQSILASVGVAALYFELRGVKEGVGPETLAEVFA